jgi:hypothetical protein
MTSVADDENPAMQSTATPALVPREVFDNLETLVCLLRGDSSMSLIVVQIERVTEYILDYEEDVALQPPVPGSDEIRLTVNRSIVDYAATVMDFLSRRILSPACNYWVKAFRELADRARQRTGDYPRHSPVA